MTLLCRATTTNLFARLPKLHPHSTRQLSSFAATVNMKPIKLFTNSTPNGYKVSILLEELKLAYGSKTGFDYETVKIKFDENEQKSEWFLKINPNGRIPALTDPNKGSGEGFHVFETAAMLVYLQEHYDPDNLFSFAQGEGDADLLRSEILQWIFFVHGGVGPMQGQANHFNHYAPEDIPYGKTRYTNETVRLYSVLESRLQGRDWLVGPGKGKYTIADMNGYPWVHMGVYSGLKDDDVGPNVRAWIQRNYERQGVKNGVAVPSANDLWEEMIKPGFAEKHGKAVAERSAKNAKWIQAGNKQ